LGGNGGAGSIFVVGCAGAGSVVGVGCAGAGSFVVVGLEVHDNGCTGSVVSVVVCGDGFI
ncbi:PE family protein, partial [Candidatus Woesearchaeota archaeon]|nr:PE family protein [Candidatus Woesearchaeota archaeon]